MTVSYEALERLFHEPSRLAIVSELSANREGMAFSKLRDACDLSDGNLNRHLAMLQDAGAVKLHKSFVDLKPRTTINLTAKGRRDFLAYLDALEEVLKEASKRARTQKNEVPIGALKSVKA